MIETILIILVIFVCIIVYRFYSFYHGLYLTEDYQFAKKSITESDKIKEETGGIKSFSKYKDKKNHKYDSITFKQGKTIWAKYHFFVEGKTKNVIIELSMERDETHHWYIEYLIIQDAATSN
ncbi:MAG: hypothetical protein CMO01_30925 [Thalassobius sp.]|nr:hypothetical protein [Thalassovita sp.]